MKKRTRIAVISDLHIGKKAVALDLCPHKVEPEQQVSFITNYLDAFHNYVTSNTFRTLGPIDMLCVTGDISNEAYPEEFKLANDVITKISDSLGVDKNRIYFVPGNHDLHWPVMRLLPTSFWAQYRYAPLLQEGLIFHSRSVKATAGTFQDSPHFVAWKDANHLVIGINSAAFDKPVPDEGKHHGLVPHQTLDKLEAFLRTVKPEDTELRICLIHHHPVPYSDPQQDVPDFSALTNAENFFRVLSAHRFDLVIHGHKHVPHISHAPFVTNGHPVTVLGAGSFSARLDSKWVGLAQNQFHVIEIEGRNPTTNVAFGHVATWEFIAGRWNDSHSRLGLCATENFGNMDTPTELINTIGEHVDDVLNSSQMCRWDDLVSRAPRLAHANTKVAYEALIEVGKARGLRHFGEVDSKGRNWGLYRA